MKILVCPDSFKGSLTACEASEAMEKGIREAGFTGDVVLCEMSDGGEGFNSILKKYKSFEVFGVETVDALDRKIWSEYLIDRENKTAYIESAAIIGIDKLKSEDRNPFKASSKGLGIMIKDAMVRGVKELFVSLGGSAVVDGGMGMLSVLGIEFLNNSGDVLEGNGREMSEIVDCNVGNFTSNFTGLKIHIVCDVINPLLGERGAVYTFAIQKGAGPEDLPSLERGMKNLCLHLEQKGLAHKDDILKTGAGAAGGLGYALGAVLKADYICGMDFIKELTGFRHKLKDADLVMTGEGCVDNQSLMGKVLNGILKEASLRNVPVVTFGGKVKDEDTLIEGGVTDVIEISHPSLSDEINMQKERASANLRVAVKNYILDKFATDSRSR